MCRSKFIFHLRREEFLRSELLCTLHLILRGMIYTVVLACASLNIHLTHSTDLRLVCRVFTPPGATSFPRAVSDNRKRSIMEHERREVLAEQEGCLSVTEASSEINNWRQSCNTWICILGIGEMDRNALNSWHVQNKVLGTSHNSRCGNLMTPPHPPEGRF